MLHCSESDLRFLVETLATKRRDYDHVVSLIRGKEDLLDPCSMIRSLRSGSFVMRKP